MHPESRHPWCIMILHSNNIIFTSTPSFLCISSITTGQSDILLGWYLQRYDTKSSLPQSSTSLGDSWGVSFVVVPCQFTYYEIDFIFTGEYTLSSTLIDDSWDSLYLQDPWLDILHFAPLTLCDNNAVTWDDSYDSPFFNSAIYYAVYVDSPHNSPSCLSYFQTW